jgi:integrase
MPNALHKLSARCVATESKAGRHSDGGGLYLVVSPSGSRKWLFIYRSAGKQREMGLGSAAGAGSVSLADARAQAADCRAVLARGGDPIEARREQAGPASGPKVPTFGAFADQYIAAHRSSWRNEKHVGQWQTTLSTYAEPIRGKLVDEVTREDVLAILKPIWTEKNETASRLRGRIEVVLDAAKAEGLRTGENPAAWKGNLKHSLPKRQKLQRGHHPAMAYEKVPAFVQALRMREATAARALEFLIFTAARSGEVLGARWSEIDLERGIWTLPAIRMKAGREHRVPLSARAMEILQEMAALRESDLVFPGRGGRPLSNMAMEMLLRRMKVGNVTVHGFRSSFRDWAAEETPFAREIAEAALAHVVGDMTERAYRRGDALEKRRQLMQAWDRYLSSRRGVSESKT